MSEKAKEQAPPPSLLRSVLNLLPLLILTWYLCQNRPEASPEAQLDLCGQNLHSIGVSLEKNRLMSDDLLYIKELDKLFKDNKLPACPRGGKEAYLEGYQPADDGKSYLLVCKGAHHKEADVPSDYPRIGFSVDEANPSGSVSEIQEENKPQEVSGSPTPKETPVQVESAAPKVQAPQPEKSPVSRTTPNAK